MKIIRFDPEPQTAKKTTSHHKMYLDETVFSCPNCNKKSKSKFTDMIFRVLEFYCGHCGSFFKVTNPAFTPPPPSEK
jgi:transcription elongation factor Elf1